MRSILILWMCCAWASVPALAQEWCDLSDRVVIEVPMSDLAPAGPSLYAATGTRNLRVIDAADPANLVVVQSVELADTATFVRTRGDLALAGRTLLDISVRDTPKVMSALELPPNLTNPRDAAIGEGWLTIASLTRVAVYDIADPTEPALIGTWSASGITGVDVWGDLIAVSHNQGVTILSRPTSGDPDILATQAFSGGAMDVLFKEQHLYATAQGVLWTFDTTDPQAPVQVDSLPVLGTKLLLDSALLYVFGDVITMLDVSAQARPRELWRSTATSAAYVSLAVSGSRLHASLGANGIETFSLDLIPDIAQTTGRLTRRFRRFAIEGDRLVGASLSGSSGGLGVFDLTDPLLPSESAFEQVRDFDGIVFNGDVLAGYKDQWLYLHDLSSKGQLGELARIQLSGDIGRLEFQGTTAIAAVPGGLRIIDTSIPGLMFQIAEVVVTNVSDIAYQADRNLLVVLARYPSRLEFYDVSVPSIPSLISTFQFPNEAIPIASLEVSGDTIWVLANSAIVAVDAADVSSAAFIGSAPLPTGSSSGDLVVSENLAAVRDGTQLLVFESDDAVVPVVTLQMAPLSKLLRIRDGRLWFVEAEDKLASFALTDGWNGPVFASVGSQVPISADSQGDLAYWLGGGGNLTVFDTERMAVLSAVRLPAARSGQIAVSDGLAYISGGSNRLLTVDVSDPENLALLSDQPASAGRPIVTDHALVIQTSQTLRSYPFDAWSIPGPTADFLTLPQTVQDIAGQGTALYAACSTAGLQVVDASDPLNLFVRQVFVALTGGTPAAYSVRAVGLRGNRAYIGLLNTPGWILDIDRPFVPLFVGTFPDDYSVRTIKASDELVFTANSSSAIGLVAYDATDPDALVGTLFETQTFQPSDFWLAGDRVIARMNTSTIALYSFRGCQADCVADFAEPFGELNFFDVVAFLSAFAAQNHSADLAPPFGVWDFFDLSTYLSAFNAGCQE